MVSCEEGECPQGFRAGGGGGGVGKRGCGSGVGCYCRWMVGDMGCDGGGLCIVVGLEKELVRNMR